MEAVWGAALSFLFILATLSGYGAGTPQQDKSDKDKSEQSDKKDDDKKNDSDKSDDGSSKSKSGKSDKKAKSGHKDKGSPDRPSKTKAEYCIKDCPEVWRIRP